MTDGQIISLWQEGRRDEAFRELVAAYSERLYWHVRRLTGSHEDTDDLLQEIFVRAWAALPSFRGEAQLGTWLWRIATNQSLNFLRQQRLRAALSFKSLDRYEAQRIDEDPWFDGDAAERRLMKALARLPHKQRIVFSLRYFDEMSYEEMARVLDTSVGALKASYHFASEIIRAELSD